METCRRCNRELIEAAHAAGHDLVREYNADGSIDPFMSCYNVFFLRGDQNPEAPRGVACFSNSLKLQSERMNRASGF